MKRLVLTVAVLAAIQVFAAGICSAEYGRGNRVQDSMLLEAGQVSAALVNTEMQLIGGPKTEGREGDFVIWNNRVGFVIAGARPASGMCPMGGVVEDAGLIRTGDDGVKYWYNLMGDSPFVFFKGSDPIFGSRVFAPVKAEVLKDGSDGEAVIRVYGMDAEFDMRKDISGVSASSLRLKIMIDYILKPNSNILETKVTLLNGRDKSQSISIGQLYVMGDGAPLFMPGHGFDLNQATGLSVPYMAAEGEVVSYAWYTPGEDTSIHTKLTKALITRLGSVKVPKKGEAVFTQYMIVGDGDMNSIYESVLAISGESAGTIQGKIAAADGSVSEDTSVTVITEDGKPLNRAFPGADGSFSLSMKPGKYLVQAFSYDRIVPDALPVEVKAGETSKADIEMEAPAIVEYDIKDDSGNNIPAVISFKRSQDNRVSDDRFYVNRNGGGFQENSFTVTGQGEVRVKPGEYDVYFSHGFEYEYVKKELALEPGARQTVSVVLDHVVDTAGYFSGDFHIHAQASFDTNDTFTEKVTAIAACGLEVAIATDHNRRSDYAPFIRKLGLEKKLKSIVGNEITTMRLGHFNVFPVKHKWEAPNEGAVSPILRTMPDIFTEVVADSDTKTIIQLNHPRALGGGYLGFVGYEPETGLWKDGDNFYMDFDAIEVVNSAVYDDSEDVIQDWYSFLNRGKLAAGTGNSDSHRVFELSVGYPRNYVKYPSEVPGEVVDSEFVKAVAGQHITVSGGPFVRANVNGQGEMGDTVTDTDGEVELNVEVQAPSWIEFDTVVVIANGEEILKEAVAGTDTPVRFKRTFKVNPERDTWYVVRVESDGDLFPVYPGKEPFAFTNPVYVDVDGNGVYDPQYEFAGLQ